MTGLYTIQEVVEITGLSDHTLRFYERIGLIQNVIRAKNGHRRYSDSHLGLIRFILLLRETGMSLDDIAEFMRLEQNGRSTLDKRLEMLQAHQMDLMRHITILNQHLHALNDKIMYYRTAEPELCDCLVNNDLELIGDRAHAGNTDF